jgi:hypothetical protein
MIKKFKATYLFLSTLVIGLLQIPLLLQNPLPEIRYFILMTLQLAI